MSPTFFKATRTSVFSKFTPKTIWAPEGGRINSSQQFATFTRYRFTALVCPLAAKARSTEIIWARLAELNKRYEPGLFSEHLAWSTHETTYYNDLLPVPYDQATLIRVCDHIDEVQDVMGRQMLLENPSTYIAYAQSTFSELDFLKEITRRTGCGLLLDVNNIYVSCTNQEQSPAAYLAEFPMQYVGEIHLGGHAPDMDEAGRPLLIDAHDRAVDDAVWALYKDVIGMHGALPTLIEWDNDVPAWPVLLREADAAQEILRRAEDADLKAVS